MKDLSESRVLVVDDSEANVDVLVEALRDEYKLSVAMDGEAALRAIEKNPPDIVLLDIMMPGIDGYEVCRRIRAERGLARPAGDVPQLAGGRPRQGARLRGRGQRLRHQAVRAARGAGAGELAPALEGLRRRGEGSDGARPAHRARDPDGHPAGRPRRHTKGTGLDVAALLEPAREVGGDLYEVLHPAEDRVFVALGDVSGKGIPAALFMAVTMTLCARWPASTTTRRRSCAA